MVEPSIISLVKKRKNAAFKAMYQSCIHYVYSIVRRYVSNESEHADVIQEIFARVFLSIRTFDESKGNFKFWLRRLVINQCLQHYRKNKSSAIIVSLDVVKEAETPSETLLNQLTKAEIESYLSEMPTGYRQVFMLVIIDDYSHKEASSMLGISVATCRSQLSRAKNWLRKKKSNNNTLKLSVSGL